MFGLGAGKIELNLPKTAYNRGEELKGTLLLTLNQPVKARGLFVKFYAEQKHREMRGSGKDRELKDTIRTIYEFQAELDKEREYLKTDAPAAYPFTFTIPPAPQVDIGQIIPPGVPDILVSALNLIPKTTGPIGPMMWYLEGYLDLPVAFDISKKVQLNIDGN